MIRACHTHHPNRSSSHAPNAHRFRSFWMVCPVCTHPRRPPAPPLMSGAERDAFMAGVVTGIVVTTIVMAIAFTL